MPKCRAALLFLFMIEQRVIAQTGVRVDGPVSGSDGKPVSGAVVSAVTALPSPKYTSLPPTSGSTVATGISAPNGTFVLDNVTPAEVGKQPKGEPGKFGSPQAGDSKKG